MLITYQRSRSDQLECVLGTPTMQINNGGCLSFSKLIGDYRDIWLDIPNELMLGFNPPPLFHPEARRLKMEDPRVVQKCNEQLHKFCLNDNLYE